MAGRWSAFFYPTEPFGLDAADSVIQSKRMIVIVLDFPGVDP